jgi:hypothetical protein
VDYSVKAADPKYHVAAGNRLEAMLAKRSLYYTRNRDGNRRVRAGACAEARGVSVIRPGIFVDIFGVETFVPLAELSYQRMMDATTAFQPGQRVLVRILRIQGQRPSEITVEASVKQAGENPYEKAVRSGAKEVWLTERGNMYGYNNLVVDFRNIADMLKISPTVVMDCTHSVQRPGAAGGKTGGNREFVPAMAEAAKAFGANGFFFEVHPEPDAALSDGPNMLCLDELESVVAKLL